MISLRRTEIQFSKSTMTAVIFTATIFLSASLLFFVQPLFTKIVLPAIGGAAAVWTTAMLFFQSILIAGYLYAHLMTRYVPLRAQLIVHLALWATALVFLPLALPADWSYDAQRSTVLQTLMLYALGVGVPFAMLSANAPLIQSWYARTNGPSAQDPYFLYGASNLGSLVSLLAFPLVAEPLFRASGIGMGWAVAFVCLGPMLLLSGLRARPGSAAVSVAASAVEEAAAARPTAIQICKWLFLAFLPSSLMLGVTSKISTDLGSFPLVWAVPLVLYLLTFVLTFTNRPLVGMEGLRSGLRAALLILAILTTTIFTPSLSWSQSALVLVAFFIAALTAHRALYESRPAMAQLTLFYVVMSVGGALGGLFNSIIAPIVFSDFLELRVTVALTALLLIRPGSSLRWGDLALGVGIGLAAVVPLSAIPDTMAGSAQLQTVVVLFVLLLAMMRFRERSVAVTLSVMTLVVGASILGTSPALFQERSFFGPHRVIEKDGLRLYTNGTTVHGAERIADLDQPRPMPMTYYYPGSPLAQVMTSAMGQRAGHVGIVGLGAGAMACFSQPGQSWDFYEIDKMVDDIARDSSLFTFMSRCAPDSPTHLGDARIVLQQQTNQKFNILAIDAYSSDAVPVHLTTVEAVSLYRDRLAPGGVLVFHISNRYYNIDIPLGRMASSLGMTALIQHDTDGSHTEEGAYPSTVVIMAREKDDLAEFAADPRWVPLVSDGGRLWTDDYANLLSILR